MLKNIAAQMLLKLRAFNRERVQRRRIGRMTPNSSRISRHQRARYTPTSGHGGELESPLVSIIIVGYNGAQHLPDLSSCLADQTYQNFEVIYVDNASSDGSCDLVEALIPRAKIVRSETNTGFAEGNNIGVDHARGDFLLLLNNDARLQSDALQRMVAALCADSALGAVAPKIRFWEQFVECEVRGPGLPLHDLNVTVVQSTTGYTKVISLHGQDGAARKFRVPESATALGAGYKVSHSAAPPLPQLLINGQPVAWGEQLPKQAGKWIINNAGSWVSTGGEAGDWGLGQIDNGQYDLPAIVDAFCGCCALIRRSALGLKPLFPPSFFAYFEDTEVSERITGAGFNILYTPSAVVYHKHASTSVEYSPFFNYFTRRNQLAFQAAHFKIGDIKRFLPQLNNWRVDGVSSITSASILGKGPYSDDVGLIEDALRLMAQARNGTIYRRDFPRKRIAIYNEFWEARGGGELRALHVAQQLTAIGDVYLISKRHLDLRALCGHFGMEPGELRLAVVPCFQSEDTADLDIFINTAFHSKINSRAKKSAYLVSFPHVDGHISTMLGYDVVLANSVFTEKWCRHIWPGARVELLYPSVEQPQLVTVEKRSRTIVSIGRFFDNGHSKKQLEMVEAFSRLSKRAASADWRLVLIGGCNRSNPVDVAYLQRVREKAAGLPIDILVDASADVAKQTLNDASIYWHATGVGVPDFEPVRFEHFGMAIVEAMSHGLIPVVHGRGGAPEIVEHGKSGYHFQSLEDLIEQTDKLMEMRAAEPQAFFDMAEAAHQRAKAFSPESHRASLSSLVERYLV